jgi:uncharacterized membrane protein
MNLIVIYSLIVLVLMGTPWILDIVMAYRSQNRMREALIGNAAKNNLTLSELKELLKEARRAPGGIQGMSRASMALSAILILGIAVFHLLVNGSESDSQIISNVLSLLGGLLAAITGFYFGGRTVEKEEEKKEEKLKE